MVGLNGETQIYNWWHIKSLLVGTVVLITTVGKACGCSSLKPAHWREEGELDPMGVKHHQFS